MKILFWKSVYLMAMFKKKPGDTSDPSTQADMAVRKLIQREKGTFFTDGDL